MALDQDLLTQVVNVNWESGLAVEFTERPDYLTLKHALSMNKVVISFWFRIPTEAAEAVRARTQILWDYRVFLGVIPLITWGSQQTTPVTETESYDTGSLAVSAPNYAAIMLQRVSVGHSAPLQPSCIGVRVGSSLSPRDPPRLDVHIQTDVHATGTNLAKINTAFTGDFLGINENPGPDFGKPVYTNVKYTTEDVSYIVTEEPEYLGNSDSNSSGSGAGYPEVTLDEWHHLLISWDLLSHSNNSGAAKMWCAIDDVNKDGNDLPAMNDSSKMPPNNHMTWTAFNWQGSDKSSVNVTFGTNDVPSNPFQLPGPSSVQYSTDDHGGMDTLSPIEKVELAELQIFSGVTLDTSNKASRRAFIDFERDEDGNPIRDADGKLTLKPVNPKQAEERLGKRPAILLHGSTEWQKGKNTGSVGVDTDGKEIPTGQFKPTGIITKYTPDPEITEA